MAVLQDCPACGGAAPPFELDEKTFGPLWHAAVQAALKDIGITELTWSAAVMSGPVPSSSPSSYDPTPPGTLMLTMSRPDEEMCLSLIHELGHAVLHPIGQPHAVARHLAHPRPEERLVHAAADLACREYGITNYTSRMHSIGVAADYCVVMSELTASEQEDAEIIGQKLISLLAERGHAE